MASRYTSRPVQMGLLLACLCSAESVAQSPEKTGPRVSGGLLGAAQQSAFRVTEGTATYEQSIGWAGGVWLAIPLGRFFSLEPQVQYSSLPSLQTAGQRPRAFLADATVTWLSAPIALKIHLGPLALVAGGQIDYPIAVVDDPNLITKDDVPTISYAATGGVELFPRSRVTLYGRYVYGLTNVDGRALTTPTPMLYQQTVLAGLKLRAFGGRRSRSGTTDPTPQDAKGEASARVNAKDAQKETKAKDTKDAKGAKGAKTPMLQVAPLADSDGDKVADAGDKCPTVFGVARNMGCPMPDTDDDGVTDTFDKCPQVAGRVKNEGCPSTDSDNDGITDEDDRCPTVVGTAAFAGCGPPDLDRDGIVDADDRCPGVSGVKEMMGCPRIAAFSASAVTFASARIKLTPEGRAELEKVVEYLTAYPNVAVRLEGHTDSRSSDLTNNPLSERRALAARAYLLSRGIAESRITTSGHGSTRPTTGNGTAEGRSKNRRVEVVVR
jgi:outer membrane protein OmpA-like peptidoglycan-associated protein